MANEQLTPEMQLTMHLAQFEDLKIIRDILIPAEDGKTMHIDFLILTRAGIFVCEMKTFHGTIQGEGMKKYWKNFSGDREVDYYSPVLQNLYHLKYLRDFLAPLPFEIYYHSIVIMYRYAGARLEIKPPYPPRTNIVTSLQSLQKVMQDVAEQQKKYLSDGELDYIFDFIGQNQIRGDIARIEHEQNSIQYKNSARMALLHQICPECRAKLKAYSTPQGNYWVCSNYPKCEYRHKM